MDLKRFGCQEEPFFEAPDHRYVYFDDLRRRVQEEIIGSIGRISGAIVLTGEAGVGKTTMLHRLVEDIESRTDCYLLSSMPWLTCRQGTTLRELAEVFSYARCVARSGDMELEEHFGAGLAAGDRGGYARGPRGKRLAGLILDDAHRLAPQVVVQFRRWRTAFQSVRGPLSVILTTTSEEGVADADGIADVSAGVGSKDVIIRLCPFNRDDVQQLIDYRLRVAGYAGPLLFSPEAVTRLFVHAKGNPSRTMRLCRRAVALAADEGGPISVAEINAAARTELMPQPNLKRNGILRRIPAVGSAKVPGLPPAPGMPAHVRPVHMKFTVRGSSGRSSPAFRGRKALRGRLLDFASATTSMVTVLAVGWFYIAEQDAVVHSIATIETTIPAGVAAAIASVQPGGDQRATDLAGEIAPPVDAPVNAVLEVLPREVETPRLRDLDQVVVTDISAADDQQPSSATGREPVAVEPEPLRAPTAPLSPPDAGALLSPDAGPLVSPDASPLVSPDPRPVVIEPKPLEAETAPAVEDLLDRGNRLLELGDVAAARLFYGMATERGSAEGALLMGITFDPAYFERKGIRGTRPHLVKAADWYQKAAALGSPAAEERKSALESRLRFAMQEGDEDARYALQRLFESPPQ